MRTWKRNDLKKKKSTLTIIDKNLLDTLWKLTGLLQMVRAMCARGLRKLNFVHSLLLYNNVHTIF